MKAKKLRDVYERYPEAYFIMYCRGLYIEYGKLNDNSPELDVEPSSEVDLYIDDGVLYASFDVDSFFDFSIFLTNKIKDFF